MIECPPKGGNSSHPISEKDYINELRFSERKRGNKRLPNRTTLRRNLESQDLWPYEVFQLAAERSLSGDS